MQAERSSIVLSKLRFRAFHGVLEQERRVGNDYVLDVRLDYPLEKAAESDDVADTLNYAEAYRIIAAEMKVPSRLLERVVRRIADALFAAFPLLEAVELRLIKVNPPMGADSDGAGVEMKFVRRQQKLEELAEN